MNTEAQSALQKLLHTRLHEIKVKNPSYSLRAYAKKLGLSAGAVSEILRGQRTPSSKVALKIAQALLLDPQETQNLLSAFEKKAKTIAGDSTGKEYLKLTADQFHLISDWAHYAILSLIETSNFKSSDTWIASRLGITITHTQNSIQRLERLGLIEKKSKNWVRTVAKIHTPDDVFNLSIQKAHLADMELAKEAIKLPVDLRDFTSISVPTSTQSLKKAKLAIRRFREEMSKILTQEPGTEVYQMSVYLYPLTKMSKKED